LRRGTRGLPGGSSVARLLEERCGVRNRKSLPPLSIEQILEWAHAHQKTHGGWPTQYSGQIDGTAGESWTAIQIALRKGRRGLPGGSSLARLLEERCGFRNPKNLPTLTSSKS